MQNLRRENAMAIQAWHIMKEKVSVRPETSAQDLALKMISSGLPGIPVVNDSQDVVGIATEHGVLGAVQQGLDLQQLSAETLMIKVPLMADTGISPDRLVEMLHKNQCCSVVVLTNNGKYAGVVSRHMLMDIHTSPYYARFAQKDRKAPFRCL
jgi:predicted transcriptional regulator